MNVDVRAEMFLRFDVVGSAQNKQKESTISTGKPKNQPGAILPLALRWPVGVVGYKTTAG